MALNAARLAAAIAPEIESKIRDAILSGSAVPYPNLTNFAQALAEAIAEQVVIEITTNAVVAGLPGGATVTSLPGGTGTTVGYLNSATVTGAVT